MKKILSLLCVITINISLSRGQNVISIGNYFESECVAESSQLETTAEELISSLPSSYQTDFKVLTFNYYLLDYVFDYGGFVNYSDVIDSAQNISPYYLLITKQYNSLGDCNKFDIKIKLPIENEFSCLDSLSRVNLEIMLNSNISNNYNKNESKGCEVMYPEIEMIRFLNGILLDIINNNCKIPSDKTISEWLNAEGFIQLDVECKILGPLESLNSNISQRSSILTDYVTDYPELTVNINGSDKNLANEINSFIDDNNLSDSYPIFYIMGNDDIFNGNYENSKISIINNLPYLGGIIYLRKNIVGPDKLYLKIEGYKSNDILKAISYDETYVAPSPVGCVNFQDLVNTVNDADQILLDNGYADIKDRIKIIRGLYYGTDWSMDFNQNYGNEIRNAGFNVFLCSSTPLNPASLFGTTLFQKLSRSPEVNNGQQGVDWGHIIIGLEARLNWCSREQEIPIYESTGLEMVTWMGDIGGGSGMLAFKRVQNPSKRAIDMFSNVSDFGGWINLEGDMAAYIIGRDTTFIDEPPILTANSDATISEILSSYLLPQPSVSGSEWQNRSLIFVQMLGGVLNQNNELINEEQLSNIIKAKTKNFAEAYLIQLAYTRNKDNNPNNDINMYESSKYIESAAKDITFIFIGSLKNSIRKPKAHITSENINPDPSPPGEPYIRYKLWEGTKSLIKDIGEWFKN